jgi:hypothetical protein
MRRLLSIPLVVIGVVAVALGSVLWWIDQQIFDTATVAGHAKQILAKPAIQAELRSAIVNKVVLIVGNEKAKSQIDALVRKELTDTVFQRDFTDSVVATHQTLLDPSVSSIRFDLSAVAVDLAAQLEPTNAPAATQISNNTGALRFDLINRAQLPGQWRLAERWHRFAPLYFGLGVLLVVAGIVVGPGRWGLLVTTGVGLVVLCTASVLAAKYAVSSGVAATAAPADKSAILALTQPFISDLTTQSVVLGVIGLLVALVGAGLGVMGIGRTPTTAWSPPANIRQANWR